MRISPRMKLFAAVALLAVAGLCSATGTAGWVTAARWLLAAAAVGGMAVWFARARRTGAVPPPAPRLSVCARAGLSARCSVALVEADGRSYLVAFGDGFASIHEPRVSRSSRAVMAQARRPAPRPRVRGGVR